MMLTCRVHELRSDFLRLAGPVRDGFHRNHRAKLHRLGLHNGNAAGFPSGDGHPVHTESFGKLFLGHLKLFAEIARGE